MGLSPGTVHVYASIEAMPKSMDQIVVSQYATRPKLTPEIMSVWLAFDHPDRVDLQHQTVAIPPDLLTIKMAHRR